MINLFAPSNSSWGAAVIPQVERASVPIYGTFDVLLPFSELHLLKIAFWRLRTTYWNYPRGFAGPHPGSQTAENDNKTTCCPGPYMSVSRS